MRSKKLRILGGLLFGLSTLIFSCVKESTDKPKQNNNPIVSTPNDTNGHNTSSDSSILIEPSQKQIVTLLVDSNDFAFWNSHSPNDTAASAPLKAMTKRIYSKFKDDFDFIVFVMNNSTLPSGRPTGEFAFVRNDVSGIGLSLFDHSSDFGSSGKLQGVYFLYQKKYLSATSYGPILHEMAHRWANWIVPTSYPGHWGQELGIKGQLSDVTLNYADIELYLMGFIDPQEMTDSASIAAYQQIPAGSKTRIPNAAGSQHSFKSLLVIMSPQDLTDIEIANFNAGATLLCRTDNPTQQGTNYRKMTKGLGTLSVGALDQSLR